VSWYTIIVSLALLGPFAVVLVRASVDKHFADSFPNYRIDGIFVPHWILFPVGAVLSVICFGHFVMMLYVKLVVRPSLLLRPTYVAVPAPFESYLPWHFTVTGRVRTVHFSSVTSVRLMERRSRRRCTETKYRYIELTFRRIELVPPPWWDSAAQGRVEIHAMLLPRGDKDLDEAWRFVEAKTRPYLQQRAATQAISQAIGRPA